MLVLRDSAKACNTNIPRWAIAEPNKTEGLLTVASGLGLEEEHKIQRGATRVMAKTRTSNSLFGFLQHLRKTEAQNGLQVRKTTLEF